MLLQNPGRRKSSLAKGTLRQYDERYRLLNHTRQMAPKHKKSYRFIRWEMPMGCMTFPGQSALIIPDTEATAGQGSYAVKVQLGELKCLLAVLTGT